MTDPRPEPLTAHDAHCVDRLTRGRPLTDAEIACYIADHQTALRHGTANVGDEIAEQLRDRLATLDAERARRDEAHAFGYREGYRAAERARPPQAEGLLAEALGITQSASDFRAALRAEATRDEGLDVALMSLVRASRRYSDGQVTLSANTFDDAVEHILRARLTSPAPKP